MTTYTKRDLIELAHDNDTAAVLEALMALGQERLDQEADGGTLYATFADFCWHTGKALTVDVFDLWLDGCVEGEQLDACRVAAARALLEAKS